MATCDATKSVFLPILASIQQFMEDIRLHCLGGASVAERCMATGWSRAMRYLRKHQKVGLSFLKDVHFPDEDAPDKQMSDGHVSSADNVADCQTKALPWPSFAKHKAFMGVGTEKLLPSTHPT